MDELIDRFTRYCLEYTNLSTESVFNRYMKLLTKQEIEMLKPYFMLMIKTGEAAKNAIPEVKKMILPN